MKKIIFKASTLVAFFGIFTNTASADIVIQGKAVSAGQSGGNTYIKCKKRGECVRIESNIAYIYFEDGTATKMEFSGRYDAIACDPEIEGDVCYDVVLYH